MKTRCKVAELSRVRERETSSGGAGVHRVGVARTSDGVGVLRKLRTGLWEIHLAALACFLHLKHLN